MNCRGMKPPLQTEGTIETERTAFQNDCFEIDLPYVPNGQIFCSQILRYGLVKPSQDHYVWSTGASCHIR